MDWDQVVIQVDVRTVFVTGVVLGVLMVSGLLMSRWIVRGCGGGRNGGYTHWPRQ